MSRQGTIKKIRLIAIGICVVFTLSLAALTIQRYYTSREALAQLQQEEDRLAKLKKDIEDTKNSIERYKKEQEEFKKLLFDERDVPAFLDGISESAAKSSVYVLEMKTQQFTEVEVPKDMADSRKLARVRVTEDLEKNSQPDRKVQLKDMLTLAAMPIRIKIDGTFEAIVNFLNSIEGYKQLLTVSNVEITTRSDYPQLTCEFTLRIYSLKRLGDIKP